MMKGLISTRLVKLKVAAAMLNRMKRFEDYHFLLKSSEGENLQLTLRQAGLPDRTNLNRQVSLTTAVLIQLSFQVQNLSKQLESIGEMYKADSH